MSEQSIASTPGLSYASAPRANGYEEYVFPAGVPLYFPKACCDCLKPTDTKYTIRGNQIRYRRGLSGAILREIDGRSDYFEMRVPVCNRCWRAYRARRRSWVWLGPAIGGGVGLAIGAIVLMTAARAGEVTTGAFAIPIALFFLGAICGLVLLTSAILARAGQPPVKVHLHRSVNRIGIRFRNPDFVPLFLRAQETSPAEDAARLGEMADAPEAVEPAPDAWYYLKDGEPTGPTTFHALKGMAATSELSPTDHVYTEGQPDWLQAANVAGLLPDDSAS